MKKYLVDMFMQDDDKYDCICDVPEEIRDFDSENKNSLLIGFDRKEDLEKFIAEVLNESPHILYAIGHEDRDELRQIKTHN